MREITIPLTNEYLESHKPEYSYTWEDYIKLYEQTDFDDYNEYL